MATGMQIGDITSKISSTAHDLSWLLGTVGFIRGVTYLDRNMVGQTGYSTNVAWQIKDMLTNFGIGEVDVSFLNGAPKGAFVSLPNAGKFNPLAVLNKDTAIAAGLYLLKDMWPNKFVRLLYNVAFPFELGAGLGRIFDDPIATSQSLTQPAGNAYPVANYSAQARNGLPVSTAQPWTGA